MSLPFAKHFLFLGKLIWLWIALLLWPACQFGPISADKATEKLTLAEGLTATLFASEPDVVNPTNLNVDERGRVWITEGYNYRTKENPGNDYRPEGDRIVILEDLDGDGRSDKSKVYYQGEDVNAALGIWVMGNKVIVSCSPDILVFTDVDGDDIPDRKEVLFTGMMGKDHDHAVHAVVFGPDGRLYFNGGDVTFAVKDKNGDPIIDHFGRTIIQNEGDFPFRGGMAFRCETDGSNLEVIGHNFRNPYELAVDSYGTVWQTDNDDDGYQATRLNYVMEYGNFGFRDLATNSGWDENRMGFEKSYAKRHWHQSDLGVVPNLLNLGSGSPCGLVVYEGKLLPEKFHNHLIHCEAGHSEIRAYPVKAAGAGYQAEMLTIMKSDDQWFRPADVCVAPDGSLLIADWYDPGVGAHRAGDQKNGRVYRVAPAGSRYQVSVPVINDAASAVAALESPNLSTRYLSWTYLAALRDTAETALRQAWEGEDPRLRARALWLLARIPGRTQHYITQALDDDNPNIRITGIRVARQVDTLNLAGYLDRVALDPQPSVRRETALALRYVPDKETMAKIWIKLAKQYDGKDRWYLEALGIGSDMDGSLIFNAWLDSVGDNFKDNKGYRDIIGRIRAPEAMPYLVSIISDPSSEQAIIDRNFRSIRYNPSKEKEKYLIELLSLKEHPNKKRIYTQTLGELLGWQPESSPQLKELALRVLPEIKGTSKWIALVKTLRLKEHSNELLDIFLYQDDHNLATEAAEALLELDGLKAMQAKINGLSSQELNNLIPRLGWIKTGDEVPAILIKILNREDSDQFTKQLTIEALSSSWAGQQLLNRQLAEGKIEKPLVQTAALQLLNAPDPDIQANARGYLAKMDERLTDLDALSAESGTVANGKMVFGMYCASCHQVDGKGINFGPNLSAIGSKLAKKALYESIIYPSAGINHGYQGSLVSLTNRSKYAGIILSENEEKLTLKLMGGITKDIAKEDIQSVEEMKQSLMMEGLAQAMTRQQLVDLVEYLSSLKTDEVLTSNLGER